MEAKYCLIAVVSMALMSVAVSAADNGCGGKPADVIFVLDSSGSIWAPDFRKQLHFVSDVIDSFDVSSDMMRVGALSFSNWAYPQFNLSTFQDKADVKHAVRKILHIRGDTNTAGALSYVTSHMFRTECGARDVTLVPRVVIVLTDGRSNNPAATAKEAQRARAAGITVFAIGVGLETDAKELAAIASLPASQYVFEVESYSALQSIKEMLAVKACQVTQPPTTTPEPTTTTDPTTTTEAKPKNDQACGSDSLVDVVFAPSPSASSMDTEKSLEFFRQITQGLDIGPGKAHVGLVPRDCEVTPEISLQSGRGVAALDLLDEMIQPEASTADVIRYMRRDSFSWRRGARDHAKRIGVVIVDSDSGHLKGALREATKAKVIHGVELYVIGVGKGVDARELQTLATTPDRHFLHVSDYDELQQYVPRLQDAMCSVRAR